MRTGHRRNHRSEGRATCPLRRARRASLAGLLAGALAGGALTGCASLMVQSGLGSAPTGVPETVLRYDWAGRRGDEVVVAYTVRADRTEAPRWVVLDLREVRRTGTGAPVGTVRAVAAPRPDPASMEAVPVFLRARGVSGAGVTTRAAIAPTSPLVLQAQAGREPELELVASDPAAPGGVRVTTWRIVLDRVPEPPEPVGRAVSRAILVPIALAVDLVTAPLQLVLFSFVGMH